jgi:hypothetical protein
MSFTASITRRERDRDEDELVSAHFEWLRLQRGTGRRQL